MAHSEEFLKLVNQAKSRIRQCGVDDVWQKMRDNQNFVLVDTREDSEWARGYIRGAIHIGKGVIERDIESSVPDKKAEIILYCGGGFRSALAADVLKTMGYTNVISMDGGWREWKEKDLPVDFPERD